MENKIVFCIVDDINTYASEEIKNTVKNIVDYTVANLLYKSYEVIIEKSEDKILQKAKDYDYAVVMSPGTEYINGFAFFEALKNLLQEDFFVAGHILDRTMYDAYYEVHHQCYVVNMTYYKRLQCPTVGVLEKNVSHTQIEPARSVDNYHDNYTPKYVRAGTQKRIYRHRCHGWNLLRLAFENNLPVLVFDESIRNNKIHYYPENEQDFYKHKEYIDYKFNYCKFEFVHTENTERNTGITEKYEQVVLPASGTLYLDLIDSGRVVFYDYNKKALDYWKENCPRKDEIEYIFAHTNLLESTSIVDYINPELKTLINLSNIFCYEGTVAKFSLSERLKAQNKLLEKLERIPDIKISFTMKAGVGLKSIL